MTGERKSVWQRSLETTGAVAASVAIALGASGCTAAQAERSPVVSTQPGDPSGEPTPDVTAEPTTEPTTDQTTESTAETADQTGDAADLEIINHFNVNAEPVPYDEAQQYSSAVMRVLLNHFGEGATVSHYDTDGGITETTSEDRDFTFVQYRGTGSFALIGSQETAQGAQGVEITGTCELGVGLGDNLSEIRDNIEQCSTDYITFWSDYKTVAIDFTAEGTKGPVDASGSARIDGFVLDTVKKR